MPVTKNRCLKKTNLRTITILTAHMIIIPTIQEFISSVLHDNHYHPSIHHCAKMCVCSDFTKQSSFRWSLWVRWELKTLRKHVGKTLMRATDSLIVIQSQPAGTERVWSFSDQEPVRSLAVASPAVMCYPALLRVVCNVFVSPDRDQRTGVRRFYKAATTPSFLTVSIHFHLYSINNIVSFQVLRGNTFTFQVACHKE